MRYSSWLVYWSADWCGGCVCCGGLISLVWFWWLLLICFPVHRCGWLFVIAMGWVWFAVVSG